MCKQAVAAFGKAGQVKHAVDICVYLNQWDMAVELAEINKFPEIESLLAQYASYLLEQKRLTNAVELYRKANLCQKAAKILFEVRYRSVFATAALGRSDLVMIQQLAQEKSKMNKSPIFIKKLYVLAALEIERYHSLHRQNKVLTSQNSTTSTSHHSERRGMVVMDGKMYERNDGGHQGDTTKAALDGFLAEDKRMTSLDAKALDKAWQGAEAFHFYALAQRQFYSGNLQDALQTVRVGGSQQRDARRIQSLILYHPPLVLLSWPQALHLREYEGLLDAQTIYSLLALISLQMQYFGSCSKAFIKLEALPNLDTIGRAKYEDMALAIFARNPPVDPKPRATLCPTCHSKILEV
jgi:WD repeat-containing protein 35